LNSVREVTDSTGAVRARYDYDPYGRTTKVSGDIDSDFGYTGSYYHADTGLYLTTGRLYNPELGIWISRDPIHEKDGLNLYAYVGQNPINYRDPTGLSKISPTEKKPGDCDDDDDDDKDHDGIPDKDEDPRKSTYESKSKLHDDPLQTEESWLSNLFTTIVQMPDDDDPQNGPKPCPPVGAAGGGGCMVYMGGPPPLPPPGGGGGTSVNFPWWLYMLMMGGYPYGYGPGEVPPPVDPLIPIPVPTISPDGDSSASPISITLAIDMLSGYSLHYTLDGSIPTASSPTYSSPFSLTFSATVRVRAFVTDPDYDGTTSAVASATFYVNDADEDGMDDTWEGTHGLSSSDPTDAYSDLDFDGLMALDEFRNETDPSNADTNGDGLTDGVSVSLGLDPTETDTDGDGLTNAQEATAGTDPLLADTDGDSVEDDTDAYPLDPQRSTTLPVLPGDTTSPTINLQEPENADLLP
jgi:RHS repeat-associated protein